MAGHITLCLSVPLLLLLCGPVTPQFPAVCVHNATLDDSTCCPTPPGFKEPCGGPTRGRCIRIPLVEDLSSVPEASLRDDRFDWPTRFFENACACFGNFSGYMCHECWFGHTGPNCDRPMKTVRRNVKSLSFEEKRRFVFLLQKSREIKSDFMVLNTTKTSDPSINPQFVSVSVYQFLSYIHYYVARKTNFGNDAMCDDPRMMWPDFAHGGPAFPLWHRLYILKWEAALRKISGDETFALPYWDWIDAGGKCDVCTDDFLGAVNKSDPSSALSSFSPIASWGTMCKPPTSGCQLCDPRKNSGPIARKPGVNPKYPDLPNRRAVDYALSQTTYDLDPYSVWSPNTVFRNVFEGFANEYGASVTNSSVHNRVHSFFNGTLTVLATAAMDPVFLVHHAFVDKLFEIWRRKNQATARQLPLRGAQPGHNRKSYLVPFFPVESSSDFFQSTENLGFVYDNLDVDNGLKKDNKDPFFLSPSWMAVILEGGVILLLLVIVVILVKSRGNTSVEENLGVKERTRGFENKYEQYDPYSESQPIMVRSDTCMEYENYQTYGPIF